MKYKIIILFCFLYCSCKNNTNNTLPLTEINIDLAECSETSLLSELSDSVFYIPLESNSECLIGQINKIVIQNDKIYILDKAVAKKVLMFDMSGKFITAFGKTGRGPGEYLQIRDFIINEENHSIEIYDAQNKRILIYAPSGDFLKQESTKFWFTAFEKVNGIYFLHTNKMINMEDSEEITYSLLLTQDKKTLSQKYFKYNPAKKVDNMSYDLQKVFTPTDDGIYVTKLLYDTIYFYENNYLRPKYHFNYGKYQMPNAFQQLPSDALIKQLKSSDKYAYAHTLYASTPQYLYFTFGYKEVLFNLYMGFFNKISQKTKIFKNITNDIDNGVFPIPMANNNEFMISVIQPYSLIEYVKNNSNITLKKHIKEIYEKINIEDNPVLMFTKLNKL